VLNGLDLFSGIGGLALALRPWVRPVCFVDIEPFCQAVLAERMGLGDLPAAPVWSDVTTLDGRPWRGVVDIIYGGFPCQDLSVAGRGAGLEGKRSGLFFEIVRLAKEIKPQFIFLENVPAIRTRGLDVVVKELADLGYDCRWGALSAHDVRAPHKRERWFLIAHSSGKRLSNGDERSRIGVTKEAQSWSEPSGMGSEEDWNKKTWTDFVRVDDGVPSRVDRVKSLGNSVVPAQAREAFRRLMGYP
jgi:DNA (cytosine-5)-methyltransferase 1